LRRRRRRTRQITTGTVAGTVKDQQSGVIPGATVTLINELKAQNRRRSSRRTPATSSSPTSLPATQRRRRDERVQDLKRSGIIVSAGDRVQVGTLTIEIGGLEQTVEINAESPIVQPNRERSFTSRLRPSKTCPSQIAARAGSFAGAGRGRHRHQPCATGRRRREQRDDWTASRRWTPAVMRFSCR